MIIQKKAYAKINLYLKILGKLPNGYHSICTVMQKIPLCDDIKINIKHGGKRAIDIICSDKSIPADKTNTAYKAAEIFFDCAGVTDSIDVQIEIEKRIPSQAGLGGGSSDAASVLTGLNEYFNFILPENVLMDAAAKIGADVPFFVQNADCAVCEGIGEIVTPVHIDLSGLFCLIVKPIYNVSTKRAYEDFDIFMGSSVRSGGVCRKFSNIIKNIHNDFSALIFSQNENIKEIKDLLTNCGADAAELTGSGSALFGVFDNLCGAAKCRDLMNQRNDIEFCDIFDMAIS